MPSLDPQYHSTIWENLLEDPTISHGTWWQIFVFLYSKNHGYSNYVKCLKRDHQSVRRDALLDPRVKKHCAQDVDIVLDEMCHLLDSQNNPSRKLKLAGAFFLKCITKVYSKIYVNNHLLPPSNGFKQNQETFKDQYLRISKELPLVILPTHRSYMDFLFISYIMTQYELPLPIVATGDNFKALGKTVTNYLKSTGAFLVRRNAQGKTDVDASVYYDTLRAYVHSILKGGENPMEFFMEGTRTRVGQVLRPKTGLLSMVADTMFDDIVEDVYILPVSINYQRPIEEQLYIAENTPEINRSKPKENTRNLINAFATIMKRKYGKVYVRFLQPFKLSEYFRAWKSATSIDTSKLDEALHDFTISLASKICLAQATNNILMPFNLITCSLLSKSFLGGSYSKESPETIRVAFTNIVQDFYLLEDLLRSTQSQFLPGWKSHLDIIDEFELDRDNIVRATADRRFVEFSNDALTFQTMLYYSNQLIQVLLPVAISSLVIEQPDSWEKYKAMRTLLSQEFFANELFIRQEFDHAMSTLQGKRISKKTEEIVFAHLRYFVACYLKFLRYLEVNDLFDKNEFFQLPIGSKLDANLYISKDMLKNMMILVKDESICEMIPDSNQLRVMDLKKLNELIDRYCDIQSLIPC